MKNLPNKLIFKIANYLEIKDAKNFAKVNKNLFFNVLNNAYFEKQIFNSDYEKKVIDAAITGINYYLKTDKEHPDYSSIIRFPYAGIHLNLNYDKGFHRAVCFYDIIGDNKLAVEFRLLAVYCLIAEKNGAHLKSRVRFELKSKVEFNALEYYLLNKYAISEKKLLDLKDTILARIHNSANVHSEKGKKSREFYFHEDYPGWKRELYELINDQIKQKESACLII